MTTIKAMKYLVKIILALAFLVYSLAAVQALKLENAIVNGGN